MTRRLKMLSALALVLSASLSGCSMLGKQTDFAEAVTSSGIGPFRALTPEELGGDAALIDQHGVGRASEIPGALFFDLALSVDESDGSEPILGLFRALPHELGCASYRGLDPVLSPELAWEGSRLFDPFVSVKADGSLELLYAAPGGIGLARADDLHAAFRRTSEAPILDGPVRAPSLVRDELLGERLYFEEAGRIFTATLEADGNARRDEPEPIVPLFPPGSFGGDQLEEEIAHASPYAIIGEMPSGRRTVRLYFVSIRASGERQLMMAASEDGIVFERSPFPILALPKTKKAGAPSARIDEDGRITHLIYIEELERGVVKRAISPPEIRLYGHPELGEMPCDE